MWKIYGLVSSLNCRVFYIGQSRQSLELRLAQTHTEWRNGRGGRSKHRAISAIAEGGGEIFIVELDCATTQLEADKLEQQHIAYLRKKCYHISNRSDGGAGNRGVKRSIAERKKIARSMQAFHQHRREQEPSNHQPQ